MATRKMFIEEDEKKVMVTPPIFEYRWFSDGLGLVIEPVPPPERYRNIQNILRWIAEVKKR